MEARMSNKSFLRLVCAAAVGLLLVFPSGCSKNEDQAAEEKGTIEKMTDQAAEKIEKKIRTPIDKAKATQNLGDERMKEMDQALQKQ